MFSSDILAVLQWWAVFAIIGVAFYPLTQRVFTQFVDHGYIFAKVLGMCVISYILFLIGITRILPFSTISTLLLSVLIALAVFYIGMRGSKTKKIFCANLLLLIGIEEILFLAGISLWAYVRGTQPDINGLEKFMDFGFVNAILRSSHFPPNDMWFTPFSINYYYFGHLITAVLTQLSFLPSNITYNLMIATLFAFCFVGSFSLGANLIANYFSSIQKDKKVRFRQIILCGLLSAILTSFAGNLHTIYAFFVGYNGETPVPPSQLPFNQTTFPNNYWYPNATRFIYHTIHEFPNYSFVVADLHGHVIDIPIVLFGLALSLSIFLDKVISKRKLLLLSFLLACMYMTNAWDGIIYFLFASLLISVKNIQLYFPKPLPKFGSMPVYIRDFFASDAFANIVFHLFILLVGYIIFVLPFSFFFKPFVSGVGVLCAPDSLTKIGKIGPFLFEKDHCQHSPLYQLLILYGFFYVYAASFLIYLKKTRRVAQTDIFALCMLLMSTILIIIPEFIYMKDIYPAHYRANTMFKLVYQSFMMLSIFSAYVIVRIITPIKNGRAGSVWSQFAFWIFVLCTILLSTLVLIYPYFSIGSYYDQLKQYKGLDGTAYLTRTHPDDAVAIKWINKNIIGDPVILEAQGDSYTDYGRYSSNTGLPTVLGWTVHEWLWRGTYDIPAPRITEVQTLYETHNQSQRKDLIKKYNIQYIVVGQMERDKYVNLNEEGIKKLSEPIFQKGTTAMYKLK